MTLLDDIIDGASGDMPVATLLRRLKVLAARTGGVALEEWVDHELNGYASPEDVPSYRGPLPAVVVADFVGWGNSHIKNIQVPPMTFPEDQREALFTVRVTNPVAELEQWALRESVELVWSGLPTWSATTTGPSRLDTSSASSRAST